MFSKLYILVMPKRISTMAKAKIMVRSTHESYLISVYAYTSKYLVRTVRPIQQISPVQHVRGGHSSCEVRALRKINKIVILCISLTKNSTDILLNSRANHD
jgi:hypothetical protein